MIRRGGPPHRPDQTEHDHGLRHDHPEARPVRPPNPDEDVPAGPGEGTRKLLVATLAVIIFVVALFRSCGEDDDARRAERATAQAAAAQQQAAAPVTTKIVRVGKEMQTFRFSDYQSRCVPLNLEDDLKYYTRGEGGMTVQRPDGVVDQVLPGEKWKPRGQFRPGIFTFCSQTLSEIDIWTIWPR